uniref:VOC domain-containing protein n=1 Tax=Leersia perrieri TaxID=77586 RepID=A0A0D9UXD5_9ORYZ
MVNTNPAQCGGGAALPLATLNHVSVVCRLFNYGIGIHLLQAEDPESLPPKKKEINPKDNHISFTCESLDVVQRRLKEMGVSYVQRRVEEGGIHVDQVFFHDPDGFMIEVCTCDKLPVVPLVDAAAAQSISGRTTPPPPATLACKIRSPPTTKASFIGEVIDVVASNGGSGGAMKI